MAGAGLRAVVVGGSWGRNHALAYRQHPDAEVAAIVGKSPQGAAHQLASELGVPFYADLGAALAEVKPEIVSCAVREADHEAVTVAALEAGSDVYCEKLMADTLAGARRMVDAAQRTGRRLMVGYNYRFSPSARQLRSLIEGGRLGTIACANAFTFGYCLHHTTDLVCSLLGQVEEVYCTLNTDVGDEPLPLPDERYSEFLYSAGRSRVSLLKFADGATAVLQSSNYIKVGHPAVRVDVVGSKARANMDDIVGRVHLYTDNRVAEEWMPSLVIDRLDLGSTTQAAVSAFIEAIRDGKPTPVPGEDGLARLEMEAALQRSAQENRPIRL